MGKVIKTVLNRVEGEIQLKLHWEKGKVKDAFIIAPNFRGFEFILEGKPVLDALVINPRICGICGHAHLIATTKAIENIYENTGQKIDVPQNAKLIRDITIGAEIIQNHIRWFYMFVMPDFIKLEKGRKLKAFEPVKGIKWQQAVDYSSKIVKVIAVFGGQWPHTSYAVPGGVVCDPTTFEIVEATATVDSLIKFTEENIFGMNLDTYISITSEDEFLDRAKGSDLKEFLFLCKKHKLDREGKSYHRFLTVCEMEHVFEKGITKKKKKDFHVGKVRRD
ncbi:MAG: nickel-dependent hydrogenase large subunit [Persephonella sp.]|nr:nickel-dependent hydrogenase large subunit [Persephonella sp.]